MSNFPVLTADDEGIIYAVNAANGGLEWYPDKARDGLSSYNSWVAQDGKQIITGWGEFTHIVSGGNGVIYAVDPSGDLLYFRDRARDGTEDWAYGGVGQQIGTGWGTFASILGGGCGIIYATTPDPLSEEPFGSTDYMYYYRDKAQDGTQNWANSGQGQQIGSGW
jgi:Tachylectin